MKMTKAQAGALGGQAVVAKYGNDYMRDIAKRGGRAFWDKYTIVPIHINDFMIVNRLTGKATGKTMNGAYIPERTK